MLNKVYGDETEHDLIYIIYIYVCLYMWSSIYYYNTVNYAESYWVV